MLCHLRGTSASVGLAQTGLGPNLPRVEELDGETGRELAGWAEQEEGESARPPTVQLQVVTAAGKGIQEVFGN